MAEAPAAAASQSPTPLPAPPDPVAVARAEVERDRARRHALCQAELGEVLKRHGCGLTVLLQPVNSGDGMLVRGHIQIIPD